MLGRMTTRILAVSGDEADAAVAHRIIAQEKCSHLDNVLEDRLPAAASSDATVQAARRALGIPLRGMAVVTPCRLVEYKGVLLFLEAAALSRSVDTVFVVAGDGALMQGARRWIANKGLERRIMMLGHISPIDPLYEAADVVVLCSQAEGMPYALLEAMRARKPIVATRVSGNSSIVRDGVTGRLVPPDPGQLAGVIDDLLSDAKLRESYGDNARAHFLENCLPDQYAANLLHIYGELRVE
jgi:glycosyltransferase involved in cell wall biosynthesis